MIDHITFSVRDYERSKDFYLKALEPLGIKLLMEFGKIAGFGQNGKAFFWIGEGRAGYWQPEHTAAASPMHIAFTSPDRATVDAFYKAAMTAGGRDYGPPGVRTIYHPNYYGAFVLDPDGNNVEAVCHSPGSGRHP